MYIDQLRSAYRAAPPPLVQTLEADNPWPFDGARRRGGAGRHYKLLSMDDLLRYPLPPLARDCRLFCWRVGAMQQEALDVIKAWGFTLKAEIIWIKTTKEGFLIVDTYGEEGDGVITGVNIHTDMVKMIDDGKLPVTSLHFGMGHQTRYAHEVCLIATRGNPPRLRHFRSVFFAPVMEHSEKPPLFYRIAAAMSPGPRYSLFSRRQHPGWMCDGDELDGAIVQLD